MSRLRGIGRLRAGGGNALLARATRFVSSSATNDYAVGVDSGTGGAKSTPWLTLDYALANAASGEVIALNDGTYTAATSYSVGKSLTLVAQNRRQVTLRAAATQVRTINFTSASNDTLVLSGLVIDGYSDTQQVIRLGSSALTSILTFVTIDCRFKDHTQQLIQSNSHKNLNMALVNCEASGSWSATNLIQVLLHEAGNISVDGLELTGEMTNTSTKHVLQVKSVTGATSARISRITGTVNTSAVAGGLYGVRLFNFDGAVIEDCNLAMATPAGITGALYWILCDDAARTANNGVIRRCHGHQGMDGGYGAIIGNDTPTLGDGRQNNGTIEDCVLTANSAAALPIHGCMLGFGTGGALSRNNVSGAALGLILKQQVGGSITGNTVSQANSEYIRLKGSTGVTVSGNTMNVTASYAADVLVIDSNTDPVTASTGTSVSGNIFNIDADPTGTIVEVAVDSSATFSGDTYNINTTLAGSSWSYQGTGYANLTAWKAVEPTALP